MKALKSVFFTALFCTFAFAAWLFMPAQSILEKQVLDAPFAGTPFKLVGFRSISTDPEIDPMYHYYVITDDTDVSDIEPFLITSDPFVRLTDNEEHTLTITVNGKITQYKNDLWIELPNGKLHHWYVSAIAGYVR